MCPAWCCGARTLPERVFPRASGRIVVGSIAETHHSPTHNAPLRRRTPSKRGAQGLHDIFASRPTAAGGPLRLCGAQTGVFASVPHNRATQSCHRDRAAPPSTTKTPPPCPTCRDFGPATAPPPARTWGATVEPEAAPHNSPRAASGLLCVLLAAGDEPASDPRHPSPAAQRGDGAPRTPPRCFRVDSRPCPAFPGCPPDFCWCGRG